MPSSSPSPGGTGFTLIETLVALAITGLALTAIAGVFGSGLLSHRASSEAVTALTLAESKIAAAGAAEALRPGRSAGVFAERFRWEVRIASHDDREDKSASALPRPLSSLRLYRITAAVTWRDGRRQREIALATLRLGPPPP